jgi:beta-glucosidase
MMPGVSDYDLENTYLGTFRAAIMKGKADSIRCAYNSVDGVPAGANTDLLGKHLRGQTGVQSYVVSDYDAVTNISRDHKYASTLGAGAVAAVKTGTDLTCGNE